MVRTISIIGLLMSATVFAEEVKLPYLKVGSQVYSNVTVLRANGTDIYFNHSKGLANAKLKYLEPEMQKRFGYDPKDAAETERTRTEDENRFNTAVANAAAARAEGTARAARAAQEEATAEREVPAEAISDTSMLGKTAPALDFEKWVGTKPALEGKFIIATFWSPASVASRKYVSQMNDLQTKWEQNLAVIGVVCSRDADAKAVQEAKPNFACGMDSSLKVSSAFGVTSIPTVVLLDPKGVVLYAGHPAALTPTYLLSLLGKASP